MIQQLRIPSIIGTLKMLLPLCFFTLTACSHAPHEKENPPATLSVAVAVVHEGKISARRMLAGTIAPLQNISLSNTLAEPASEIRVIEGEHVHTGDVLAILDTSDLQANLRADEASAREAEANLTKQKYTGVQNVGQGITSSDSAQAALDQANEHLKLDQTTLERDEALLKQAYIAQQTVDSQRSTVQTDLAARNSALAGLRAAQLVVRTNGGIDAASASQAGIQSASIAADEAAAAVAQAQADQLRSQIARATITAPVDAVVINRNINVGEYPNSRTLFLLQESGQVYAVLNASPSQLTGLKVGSLAKIEPNDGSGRIFYGPIVAILGQANPGSSNFSIKVLLKDPDGQLLAGLPVNATLSLQPVKGIIVPRSAFTDAVEANVVVVQAGVVHRIRVHMLGEDDRQAVVDGLHSGMTVVINGDAGLIDGQHVTTR